MSGDNLPLVSVVITSYNRSALISKAIESALAQDYPNLEIIVSDNCSTDNTDEIIRPYTNDKRIKYNRNETNIGMIPNFYKATYELSSGKYITYISSDDYLTDNKFVSDAVNVITKHPDMPIVHARMSYMNTLNGVLWEMPAEPFFLKEVWTGDEVFFGSKKTGLFSWGACLMNRQAMMDVKTLQGAYYNADLDTNYRMMLGHQVGFINRLCYMQIGHDDNNGYPANADKIIQSLECFENVAKFATVKMPSRITEIELWKDHFIYAAINWAFHSLKERNHEQYILFKKKIKEIYPQRYRSYTTSWIYLKLQIFHPVKKVVPRSFVSYIRKLKKKYHNKAIV